VISNQDRLNLIRDFCEDDLENEVENVLKNILENGSYELKSMIKLFDLMDNSSTENDLQIFYTIGNRTIEVINTCEQLLEAMNTIQLAPFIGFDSEQKPTFKKGQADNGICLIQLATKDKCYLIQNKQIKNLKPLIYFLEDEKIIKIGTGLKGDNEALFRQFNLRAKSMIDLEDIFKKLSSKNQIGAKKAASIILNEKLQKSKNMSRSNWENEELTSGQIKYATEDATVVYDVMSEILKQYPFVMKMMPEFFQLANKPL
jgi:ribonuclease D